MAFNTYAIGHDFGNTDTCSRVLAGMFKTERRIPSVFSSGSWKKVETTAKGAGKEVKDILKSDHYVLEYEAETPQGARLVGKNFGQKVFDDGDKSLDSRGDSSRYWLNNYNVEALMVSTAAQIPDKEYGVYVVTGMPISIYLDDPTNADRVQQSLIGTGTWRFRLNGVDRTMHVMQAKCIMEGAGALIANGAGGDDLQGVIDIGGHTTDLFVATGQKPQPSRCKGFPGGVAAAADRFNAKFRETYNHSLNLEVRSELLRQHIENKPYRFVTDKQRNRIPDNEIAVMLEAALRETGQDIATQVAAAWDEILMSLRQILVVGGGAHYFANDMQARFSDVHTIPEPEMANSRGYAKLADGIMHRARLQAMQSQMRSA